MPQYKSDAKGRWQSLSEHVADLETDNELLLKQVEALKEDVKYHEWRADELQTENTRPLDANDVLELREYF